MRAIGICGSPRRAGNTEILLREALSVLEAEEIETEAIYLRDYTINGCRHCGLCRTKKDRLCHGYEDDLNPILEKILGSEGLLVATPVYFSSATPETMAVLNRVGYVSRGCGKLLRRKVGGPIAVAHRAGQNFTIAQLSLFFWINEIIQPGASYWPVAFGYEPGDVKQDSEGLETVRDFARNMAWLMKKLA